MKKDANSRSISAASQSIIASRAQDCVSALAAYISKFRADREQGEGVRPLRIQEEELDQESDPRNEPTEEWAQEQQARFRMWAANLGVFARGQASVDHRLRDSSELQDLVLQLLDALYANLNFCTNRLIL